MRAGVGIIALAGLLLGLVATSASAQTAGDENWNPFTKLDQAPRRKRPSHPWIAPGWSSCRRRVRAISPSKFVTWPPSWLPTLRDCRSICGAASTWPARATASYHRSATALACFASGVAPHVVIVGISAGWCAKPGSFCCPRLEALYRSGLLGDMVRADGAGALVQVLLARKDIGLGARDAGCAAIKSLAAPTTSLRGRLKGEALLLTGYCAAAAGDPAGAGLDQAPLARGRRE